jgi:Protein of unknown function (DUF4446)
MSASILDISAMVIAGIALILSIYAVIAVGQVRKWRKYFSSDSEPENLEDIIETIAQRLELLDKADDRTVSTLEAIAKQLNTATQHVGILRYNGNGDDGGNLSFSAAMLDGAQSGIIITSLHGRQNSRIYAKVITRGASEQTLSEEEREALIQALTNNH